MQPPVTRKLVIVLGTLSAFGPLSIDLYLPGLPSLADDLGASASAAQLTLTACLIGLAVGQLVIGPLSDAYGRRDPLLLGVGIYVAATLGCAAAPSIATLVALRFVQGFTGAAGIVIARAVVRDLRSGPAASRMYAGLLLVNGLAPILAPVLGGQLLHVVDWRGVFVVLAGIGAVILASTGVLVAESHPPARRRSGGLRLTLMTFRGLLGQRRFSGAAVACGLAFGGLFAYIAGSPFVLQDIYGLTPAQFSLVFAANAIGLVAAAQVGARLAEPLGAEAVLGGGLLVGAGSGVLLLLVVVGGAGLAGVLAALFVMVACIGVVTPSATTIALEGDPGSGGSASALLGLAQFAIGATFSPLVGIAGRGTAVPMALVIAASWAGAVAVYAFAVRGSQPRPLESVQTYQ